MSGLFGMSGQGQLYQSEREPDDSDWGGAGKVSAASAGQAQFGRRACIEVAQIGRSGKRIWEIEAELGVQKVLIERNGESEHRVGHSVYRPY